MPLVSISDGSLFAERFGSGPPRVLALHGWGRRGADFSAVLCGLDALSLDLPGFGATPEPSVGMGAHGYARAVRPALELFDKPPVVVGHSFGGRVAVALEHDQPGTSSGLVLAGVPLLHRAGRTVRPPLAYRTARLAHRLNLLGDEAMERRRRRYGSADYRTARGVMRDVFVQVVNESYRQEMESLGVPVHLLWGSDDTDVPLEVARRAEEAMKAAGVKVELEVLEGVGHHLPVQAPDAIRAAIERMLERLGR